MTTWTSGMDGTAHFHKCMQTLMGPHISTFIHIHTLPAGACAAMHLQILTLATHFENGKTQNTHGSKLLVITSYVLNHLFTHVYEAKARFTFEKKYQHQKKSQKVDR